MVRGRNTRTSAAQRSRASSRSARSTGSASSTARGTSRSPSRSVLRSPAILQVDKAYDHVLQLLGFDRTLQPDHPVIQALQHASYTTFPSLFTLRRADVESLTYLDTSVTPHVRMSLPKGNQTQLLVPQGYKIYFQSIHQRPINNIDWMVTTTDEINDYLMSNDYMYFNNSDGTSTVPGPAPGVLKPRPVQEVYD